MSQVEELLNSLSEVVPEHEHTLVDTDNYFVIDPITRQITNMSRGELILMQRDHKSSVYTFQLPRYIDGHDMSLCNRVKCHFNNIGNLGEELLEHPDVVELTDLRLNPEDKSTVICSWTITRQATWYAGALGFLLQYLCVDEYGNETYEWHTDEFTAVTIKKSRNNDEAPLVEYTAIFEQWRERIFGAGDSVKSEIIALTEEKLSEVTSEGTKQVENVANEGLRVLGTIPEDYTAMSEQVGMLSRFAGPVIRQETDGEHIVVNDSAKMPLLGLQMFGKSRQKRTNGHQLCDMSRFPDFTAGGTTSVDNGNGTTTVTGGGATVVNNGDGSLTISGSGEITDLFSARFDLTHEETIALLKVGELHCNYGGITVPKLYIQLNNSSGTLASMNNQYSAESSITVTQEMLDNEELFLRFSFYQIAGGTIVPGTVKPMLYQDGDGTWEEFSGGQASPSPEYPQEIASVENPMLTIRGKNMLRESAIPTITSGNGITCDYEGNGVFHIHGIHTCETQEIQLAGTSLYMDIDPDAYYTLSVEVIEGAIPSKFHPFLGVGSENVTFRNWFSVPLLAGTSVGTIVSDTRQPSSVMNDVTQVTRFWIYNYNSDLTSYTADFRIRVWLEQSEVSTSFEPFTEQNIISSMTLPGLPVETGGNYVDKNGQQYIANYRDWERGVDVQRVNEVIFNGTENWRINGEPYPLAYIVLDNFAIDSPIMGLFSHGEYKSISSNIDGNCAVVFSNGILRMRLGHESSDKEFSDFVKSQYEAGTPVTICYILKTPIETPIPEAELQAYRELHTNYPNTTILNDSVAYMKLAYVTDTKMYIDNKFAELQAALTKES